MVYFFVAVLDDEVSNVTLSWKDYRKLDKLWHFCRLESSAGPQDTTRVLEWVEFEECTCFLNAVVLIRNMLLGG